MSLESFLELSLVSTPDSFLELSLEKSLVRCSEMSPEKRAEKKAAARDGRGAGRCWARETVE